MQLHENKTGVNGVQKLMLMQWRNLRTSLYQTQLTLILITCLELESVNTETELHWNKSSVMAWRIHPLSLRVTATEPF